MALLPIAPGPHRVNINEHLDELYTIDKEIFNNPPILFPFKNQDEFLKFLTKDHNTTVVIWNNDNGELVGYFAYEEDLDIPNTTELVNIGTLPKFQGKGYGKSMMNYYLSLFKDKNSRLVTHPNNVSARKLYEKFGYLPVKMIQNYFGDGEPRLLYFHPAIRGKIKVKT